MDYKTYLILFIIIVNILAIMEMKIYKKMKLSGKIYYKWLFRAVFVFYVMVVYSSYAEYVYFKPKINTFMITSGLIIMAAKFVLKYYSAVSLKGHWSIHIEITDNHRLVTDGPYRILRHPGYLSTIFEMMVIPFMAHAYYTISATLVLYSVLVVIRIYLEENVLIKHFKHKYLEYKKQTWSILPYVY